MNERIKELFEQAGFPKFDIKNEAEKFAELIVRQCAEICLEANDHDNILRYFGVDK